MKCILSEAKEENELVWIELCSPCSLSPQIHMLSASNLQCALTGDEVFTEVNQIKTRSSGGF